MYYFIIMEFINYFIMEQDITHDLIIDFILDFVIHFMNLYD